MNQRLFRKSSIDRVSSPEQLNDYIRVTNPGVWLVLSAVMILLMGVCVWGIFGRLETRLPAPVRVTGGEASLFLSDRQTRQVKPDMKVVIDGQSCRLGRPVGQPQQVDEKEDPYFLSLGDLESGGWVQRYALAANLPDGIYQAEIVVESVSPMSFVFN